MRAEYAAALTNFLLLFLITIGLMTAPWRSGGSVHVYADPLKAAVSTALLAIMIATPPAILAFWRTWVHAQRFLAREAMGWRGVYEAGALGFALTLVVVPGVVARQFNPGEWGQPQAFILGLGYVGVYGVLGLVVGLLLGSVLWLSARLVLLLYRRHFV